MNSIISWVGGKKALRDAIYQRMPISYEKYIEVFGGAGWVLFGKPPGEAVEIYNDLNSNLVNLFRCVRDRTMALVKELALLPLSSREEFNDLVKFLKKEEFTNPYIESELAVVREFFSGEDAEALEQAITGGNGSWDVKKAAAFYKVTRCSYGSGGTSFGCRAIDIRRTFGTLWEASRRLKDTLIENKDFEALIIQQDTEKAFFYCDPPYYETESYYEAVFRREDHERLRDILAGIRGRFLVSYNDCEYIRELYRGFQIEPVSRLNNLAQRYQGGSEYAEVLIANYDMEERKKSLPVQIRLDDLFGERWLPGAQGRETEETDA